jgi:hypothetical protein
MNLVSAPLAGIVLLRFWEEYTISALIHTEHSYRRVLPRNRDLHWAITAGGTKAGLSIPKHQPPGLSRARKADGQNRQSFSFRERQTSCWKLCLCWGFRKGVSNCRVALACTVLGHSNIWSDGLIYTCVTAFANKEKRMSRWCSLRTVIYPELAGQNPPLLSSTTTLMRILTMQEHQQSKKNSVFIV